MGRLQAIRGVAGIAGVSIRRHSGMDLERRLSWVVTILAIVAIPVTLVLIHLPHPQEIDYSVLYLAVAAMAVLIVVQNLILYYPSQQGKLFPRLPHFFLGMIMLYFIFAAIIYFSGGLGSPAFFAMLMGPLMAGVFFELPIAMASTTILALIYTSVLVTQSGFRTENLQALAFNLLYLYLACLLANRLALELRRQEQSRDEVASLGAFIRRIEKAKSEFVSMVSHELRTPLTSIHGFSEILRTMEMEPEKKAEFYRIILNESERLSRLINNLLNLSSIEAGIELNREMLDIPELLEEDLEFFRSQTSIHDLRYQGNRQLPQVYADPDRLHQIFKNILSNAIKYSPEGGPVEVETAIEGKYITVTVTDRGIGIPAEELPYIFDRFRRVERKEMSGITGTGLGLAIVKHLVDIHGGQIKVRSEAGQGSSFTVYIPIRGA
jgi:signal transduction histidine kinase